MRLLSEEGPHAGPPPLRSRERSPHPTAAPETRALAARTDRPLTGSDPAAREFAPKGLSSGAPVGSLQVPALPPEPAIPKDTCPRRPCLPLHGSDSTPPRGHPEGHPPGRSLRPRPFRRPRSRRSPRGEPPRPNPPSWPGGPALRQRHGLPKKTPASDRTTLPPSGEPAVFTWELAGLANGLLPGGSPGGVPFRAFPREGSRFPILPPALQRLCVQGNYWRWRKDKQQ